MKLCINESVSTPCTPVFSPLHTLSVLFGAAGEHRRAGGEEVGRGVNNIQLRYMTQIKDAVCDAAAY